MDAYHNIMYQYTAVEYTISCIKSPVTVNI